MNLGVDAWVMHVTPERLRPGIGLRPGGERPDLEPFVQASYAALYDSVAAHARQGLNVVVDAGHHERYSRQLTILPDCASRLRGLRVLFVGVRCPLDVIIERRNAGQPGREGTYLKAHAGEPVPAPILAWQEAVHEHGAYDLEVDTSLLSPEECAEAIRRRLKNGPAGIAFGRLAEQ